MYDIDIASAEPDSIENVYQKISRASTIDPKTFHEILQVLVKNFKNNYLNDGPEGQTLVPHVEPLCQFVENFEAVRAIVWAHRLLVNAQASEVWQA